MRRSLSIFFLLGRSGEKKPSSARYVLFFSQMRIGKRGRGREPTQHRSVCFCCWCVCFFLVECLCVYCSLFSPSICSQMFFFFLVILQFMFELIYLSMCKC